MKNVRSGPGTSFYKVINKSCENNEVSLTEENIFPQNGAEEKTTTMMILQELLL